MGTDNLPDFSELKMSVDVATFKNHFETDLDTSVIQSLLDDASAEITRRFGSDTSVTEEHILATPIGCNGSSNSFLSSDAQHVGRRHIWTKQKISSVTSVKEGVTLADADLTTLVEDTDYRVINDGWGIERIDTDFLKRVVIVYAPESDSDRRDRVTIDLVKLAIQFNGLDSERVGDWQGSHMDYQKTREEILSTLKSGRRHFA